MAFVLADRVKETTATTGTGTLNLAGAATAFQTFVASIGSGNTTDYCLLSGNGTDWEVGLGTVTSGSPNTLSRDTVYASSASGSKISLTGTSTVFCDWSARLASGMALDVVSSGTTHTVTLTSPLVQVVWRSATAGAKTTNIPGAVAANNGYQLNIKTTLGNGDSHTVTPASGTIEGAASLTFTDNKDNVALCSDGANTDWIIV